jgi:hypothetical protein
VTGDPQPSDIDQVQQYRQLVLEYEALDEEVDGLLARHNGATGKMSDEDYERYRELANHRDYVYNQMKELERQILLDDDSGR